jgi:acyl-CoA dehydrogenase
VGVLPPLRRGWLAGDRDSGALRGHGLGITEASIVLEEIAASGAAMNGCSAVHLTIFGVNVVAKHAAEELRAEIYQGRAVAEDGAGGLD